jgi:hypothetical protein
MSLEAGQSVADRFESAFSPVGCKDHLGKIFEELNDLRTNSKLISGFNSRLNDGKNDVAGLEGFELVDKDSEGDLQFARKNGARREVKPDGTIVEIWGQEENNREFVINEQDGTAIHTIRPGECVWNIAKDIVRERKGDKPTNTEIAEEVERIKKANPQIEDIDLIKQGDPLTIPKESVDSLTKERKLRNVNTVKEEMLKEGGVFDKVDSNQDGAITKEEIKQYKDKNPSMTDEERKALDMVEERFDRISKRAAIERGETIPAKESISKEDIKVWADYRIAKIKGSGERDEREEA